MSTWIIIVISLALVSIATIAALAVPVYLKFSISSKGKFLTVRYGKLRVIRFGGRDRASEIAKTPSKKDKEKSKKPSRLKAWNFSKLKKWTALTPRATRAVANLIWRLLRNIKVESLRGEVGGGFSDPALTGMLVGWSSAILGAIPALGRNISINPDFDAEKVHYDASGLIRISPLMVAGSFFRFLIEAPLFRIIKLTLTRG